MKIYNYFLLLVLAGALHMTNVHADEAADASNIVELTPEELDLQYKICSYWGHDERIATIEIRALLQFGCGFGILNRSHSYNIEERPMCPEVLAFIKRFTEEQKKLDKGADELLKKVYEARHERD